MRLPTRAADRTVAMNMTPMIDVVFLLIIFFLVSSHLARQETQMELDLPAAATGEDTVGERPRVTINVPATGEALLAGEPTPPDQLADRLAYEQSETDGGIEVRIRCDRATAYASVEPVLVACARAGVWNISFAVTSRQRPAGSRQ